MIIASDSGNRCQGLYRGKVLQHLPHGRLKVFVYGIYPEDFIEHPELLPICELITPLWGGSFRGNGSFSYPNIGSTVWILFANEDVNYPVAIGATLGGENAYNQYDNIKSKDELSSKKHMFTTGMAHLQMHEDGKISAYVELPYDNNVSIDFTHGDLSCDISAEIYQKIGNNEISHIVCQTVIDNDLNKGEISASTHFYDPFVYESSYYLSDTQEAIVSNLTKEISTLNYHQYNNIGDIIDNMVCSNVISDQYMYTNLNTLLMKLSTLNNSTNINNTETTNISSDKDIDLQSNVKNDIVISEIDAINNNIRLSTYNYEKNDLNIDENHNGEKRNIFINNDTTIKQSSIFYDNKLKYLSSLYIDDKVLNGGYKTLNSVGNKSDTVQNVSSYLQLYMHADNSTKDVVISSTDASFTLKALDNLNDGYDTQINGFSSNRDLLSTYNFNQIYLKVNPSDVIISTENKIDNSTIENDNTLLHIKQNILNSDNYLSIKIDGMKGEIYTYNSNIVDDIQNSIDNDKNAILKTETDINIVSTEIKPAKTSIYSLENVNANKLDICSSNIELDNLSTYNYSQIITPGTTYTNDLTSDNKLDIQSDNKVQLLNLYLQHINDNGSELISGKYFIISGDANSQAIMQLSNYVASETTTLKDNQVQIMMNADETPELLIDVVNNVGIRECKTRMSTDEQRITTTVSGDIGICTIDTDLDNQLIKLTVDGTTLVTLELNAIEGKIKLNATEIELVSEGKATILSEAIQLVGSSIDVNATNSLNFNSSSTTTFSGGEVIFNNPIYMNNDLIAKNIQAENIQAENIQTESINPDSHTHE